MNQIACIDGNSIALWDETGLSSSGHVSIRSNFYELENGFTVSYHTSGMHDTGEFECINESKLIHFTCMLNGWGEVEKKEENFSLPARYGYVGYSPDSLFKCQYAADFKHFLVSISQDMLVSLDSPYTDDILRSVREGYLMRSAALGIKTMELAYDISRRLAGQTIDPLFLRAEAMMFLAHFLVDIHRGRSETDVNKEDRKKILAARDRLLLDLSNPPSTYELARYIGVNEFKLKKGFQMLFGTSVYALFQQVRMERARQLLADHSVGTTASMLGYTNFSHFSSAFKKHHGFSPSEIRRLILK